MSPKFAHVVNSVKVAPSSDLYIAQPITFESMRIAQQLAATFSIPVELCAVNFPEDDEIVPKFFGCRRHLERSVLDVGRFSIPRKLPLIKDILDRATAATQAEFIIYSNVDIAVVPHFYLSLASIADEGWDAFMITRRTLSKGYTTPAQLWRMYADIGDRHPLYRSVGEAEPDGARERPAGDDGEYRQHGQRHQPGAADALSGEKGGLGHVAALHALAGTERPTPTLTLPLKGGGDGRSFPL